MDLPRVAGRCAVLACLVAAASCSAAPAPRPAATPSAVRPASRTTLAAAYLAIALPANRKLDKAEKGYSDHCKTALSAAEAALRAQAAIERGFDRRLAAIRFPPAVAATAGALIRVNQIRIAFTLRQARASSIRDLLALTVAHRAADAQVEVQVRVIRAELGLPPPSSS